MIKVTFWKRADSSYAGFDMIGHAGFANSGRDIICAAVSVLAINTVNSIEAFTALKPISDESDGHMTLQLPDLSKASAEDRRAVDLLLDSMQLGLESIKSSYGSHYLQVQTIQK